MKTASPELVALLKNNNTFSVCDLYKITLRNGTAYYYTDLDIAVVSGGITYQSGTPNFERTYVQQTISIEVDEMTITVGYEPDDVIGSVLWRDVVRTGVLDGARISVRKAFFNDFLQPAVGSVYVFEGSTGDVTSGNQSIEITVKSVTELFNTMLPRDLYSAGCPHVLYGKRCGLNKADFTVNASITSSASKVKFAANTGKSAGWFTGGSVTFTSGLNAGLSATVKSFDGTNFILNAPLLFAPAVGDQFSASAGCDRLKDTCASKFNNLLRFGGVPFTPVPETSI